MKPYEIYMKSGFQKRKAWPCLFQCPKSKGLPPSSHKQAFREAFETTEGGNSHWQKRPRINHPGAKWRLLGRKGSSRYPTSSSEEN